MYVRHFSSIHSCVGYHITKRVFVSSAANCLNPEWQMLFCTVCQFSTNSSSLRVLWYHARWHVLCPFWTILIHS